MKCLRFWRVAALLSVLASAVSMPQNSSTRSNPQPMGETIKQLTDQLMEINSTSQMTYDTRTPPRVKQHFKKLHAQQLENSHPGIAEPVDEDALLDEESTKKNFYKTDTKSTTDSGLSTWILLSGQGSLTTKPTKKSVTTKIANLTNTFVAEDLNKLIKPIFKRKLPSTTTTTTTTTTTKKPVTTASATLNLTTVVTDKTTKLTKVKASLLNNAINKSSTTKKATTPKMAVITTVTTTAKPTKQPKLTTIEPNKKKTTEYVKITTKTTKAALNNSIESNTVLEPEAKEGALDLTQTTPQSKKIKRPAVVTTTAAPLKKKNKTKNRRKRPSADDKSDGNTKVTKNKEKPFGTQIYNYLSREVMPTVGVGLVGLMVTAGLASYFLYPFGPVRRSYEIDRKDKVGSYYYNDEYSGGIAEEDAIGKVIAGMPSNANLNNYNIRAQNSRNRFQNRYRSDQSYMQGSVETVHLNPQTNYKTADLIIGSPKNHHNNYDNYEVTNEDVYTNKEPEETKKFVVGNVPKEAQEENITPMVVPEHGPRNIDKENVFVVNSVPGEPSASTEKLDHGPRLFRSRRQIVEENEIDSDNLIKQTLTTSTSNVETSSPETSTSPSSSEASPSTSIPETSTADTTYKPPYEEKSESFVELIRDLFYYKLRLGLQMLQSKTESLSRYFKRVQERIDSSYREGGRL